MDAKGSFDGQVYTNKVLGFSLTVPEGWQFQDPETQTQFAARATERSAEMAQNSAGAKASLNRTKLLFILVRPTMTATNPTIVGMLEDVALAFNVRTPEQYLMAARNAIANNPTLLFDSYTTSEKVNGIDFSWMGAHPKNPSVNVAQRYYATLQNHQAIGFVMTFHSADELEWCLQVLQGIKFN